MCWMGRFSGFGIAMSNVDGPVVNANPLAPPKQRPPVVVSPTMCALASAPMYELFAPGVPAISKSMLSPSVTFDDVNASELLRTEPPEAFHVTLPLPGPKLDVMQLAVTGPIDPASFPDVTVTPAAPVSPFEHVSAAVIVNFVFAIAVVSFRLGLSLPFAVQCTSPAPVTLVAALATPETVTNAVVTSTTITPMSASRDFEIPRMCPPTKSRVGS